jgi:hypothetical protein
MLLWVPNDGPFRGFLVLGNAMLGTREIQDSQGYQIQSISASSARCRHHVGVG